MEESDGYLISRMENNSIIQQNRRASWKTAAVLLYAVVLGEIASRENGLPIWASRFKIIR